MWGQRRSKNKWGSNMPDWMAYALSPLRNYCDPWCLQFWEMIGAWMAGLATVAAVAMSLYLARRDGRIDLRVSATVGLVYGDPHVSPTTEHVWIQVANVGRRTAILHSIGWRSGLLPHWFPWLPRQYALQGADFAGNTRLPAKLADGDTASFMIPIEGWGERVAADLMSPPRRISAYFVYVQAHCSTGDSFTRRIAPSLRKAILAYATKKTTAAESTAHEVQA